VGGGGWAVRGKGPAGKPATLGRTGCSRARACAPCRRHPRAHRRSVSGSGADERGMQKVECDIRDNPAMSRFEMPLGDDALAVAYYNVEDGRVVLREAGDHSHSIVPGGFDVTS